MKFFKAVPNYIKYIFFNVILLLFYISIFRWIFYSFFVQLESASSHHILKAYSLGFRFDIKLAVLIILPIAILIFIINNHFFTKKIFRSISRWYFIIAYIFVTLLYFSDFGHYSYLGKRVDATALRFADDLAISSQVLYESYPVIKGVIALIILGFLVNLISKYIYGYFKKHTEYHTKKKKAFFIIIPLLILAFGVYNSFTHYPLRWSQAFFSKNNQVNQFALNPVLYFFDSFKFRSDGFDLENTKKYYPKIANELGFRKDTMLFERKINKIDSIKRQPNIVIVMLESVGVAPMSYYGNAINTTPKMDSIIKLSANFSNFYIHKVGTAASVFASITGLPDVDRIKTASRNPMIINQRVVFDQFEGYEKFYFLGGSANWANIRGVFQANINNLRVFEEGSYKVEKRSDVWGIDDYELFKEADKELLKIHQQNKPFIAYIQTATNHMPFTVPDKKESFNPLSEKEITEEQLLKGGFDGVSRLNALRYLDFNVGKFLERAKKSGYHDNTIFMFFGDHNTSMLPVQSYKNEFDLNTQLSHVPFFIYAPKYVKPRKINQYRKLVDVVPTAAVLANISFTNYTLGSNALKISSNNNFAFLYDTIDGEPGFGILKDSIYFTKTNITNKIKLYHYKTGKSININKYDANELKNLDSIASSFYYSTKFLYYNNKKNK